MINFDVHAKFIDAFATAQVLENKQDMFIQAQSFECLTVWKTQGLMQKIWICWVMRSV